MGSRVVSIVTFFQETTFEFRHVVLVLVTSLIEQVLIFTTRIICIGKVAGDANERSSGVWVMI